MSTAYFKQIIEEELQKLLLEKLAGYSDDERSALAQKAGLGKFADLEGISDFDLDDMALQTRPAQRDRGTQDAGPQQLAKLQGRGSAGFPGTTGYGAPQQRRVTPITSTPWAPPRQKSPEEIAAARQSIPRFMRNYYASKGESWAQPRAPWWAQKSTYQDIGEHGPAYLDPEASLDPVTPHIVTSGTETGKHRKYIDREGNVVWRPIYKPAGEATRVQMGVLDPARASEAAGGTGTTSEELGWLQQQARGKGWLNPDQPAWRAGGAGTLHGSAAREYALGPAWAVSAMGSKERHDIERTEDFDGALLDTADYLSMVLDAAYGAGAARASRAGKFANITEDLAKHGVPDDVVRAAKNVGARQGKSPGQVIDDFLDDPYNPLYDDIVRATPRLRPKPRTGATEAIPFGKGKGAGGTAGSKRSQEAEIADWVQREPGDPKATALQKRIEKATGIEGRERTGKKPHQTKKNINLKGSRMDTVVDDPDIVKGQLTPGRSGHLGTEDYWREFDLVGSHPADPYFQTAGRGRPENAEAIENLGRHQFIRISRKAEGKPDIILNRIVTRGPGGADQIVHQGWMTPKAYNHISQQRKLLGGKRGPGLGIDDMPTLRSDGTLIGGRLEGFKTLRGATVPPAPLQENTKRRIKLNILR